LCRTSHILANLKDCIRTTLARNGQREKLTSLGSVESQQRLRKAISRSMICLAIVRRLVRRRTTGSDVAMRAIAPLRMLHVTGISVPSVTSHTSPISCGQVSPLPFLCTEHTSPPGFVSQCSSDYILAAVSFLISSYLSQSRAYLPLHLQVDCLPLLLQFLTRIYLSHFMLVQPEHTQFTALRSPARTSEQACLPCSRQIQWRTSPHQFKIQRLYRLPQT